MSRFLFTVWPFAGHLHPAIAVAHALKARGHQVAFYTGGSARQVIEGEGFRFFPFQRVDERKVSSLVASGFPYCPTLWSRIRRAKVLQKNFRTWLLDTIPEQVADIEAALGESPADALICDLAFWCPFLILGEARPIPVAVLSIAASCMLPGPDAPVWGPGTPRPRTKGMRWRGDLERALVGWVSRNFLRYVNVQRDCFGLPPLRCSVTELAGQMPLYLMPSTPEFDYQRGDLPSSVHYVGPCLWDKPGKAPAPAWLADLPSGQPLIYVTEATIGTQEPFLLKAAVLAFQNQPVQVVMTTGKQRSESDLALGTLASNLRVETYVPQSDLLPKTAVMVTLGGSGGVLAALKAGVPLVVVPTEWDRPENAQRVVEAGAGLRIAPNACTPERLRAAVQTVLTDGSYRRNAERLAADFEQYKGPARAAELLESLVVSTAGKSISGVPPCISGSNRVSLGSNF